MHGYGCLDGLRQILLAAGIRRATCPFCRGLFCDLSTWAINNAEYTDGPDGYWETEKDSNIFETFPDGPSVPIRRTWTFLTGRFGFGFSCEQYLAHWLTALLSGRRCRRCTPATELHPCRGANTPGITRAPDGAARHTHTHSTLSNTHSTTLHATTSKVQLSLTDQAVCPSQNIWRAGYSPGRSEFCLFFSWLKFQKPMSGDQSRGLATDTSS